MPSGKLTLLEAAKYGDNQIAKGMIETIIFENPMAEVLPWLPFAGNALQRDEEGTLPTVDFRSVNEGYTPSWGSDRVNFWGVAILGGEIHVDNFLVNVIGTRQSIKAKQYTKTAKANAGRFSYEAIHGTGAAKGFKGFKTLIDEGFGQKLIQASGGGALSLAKLDEAIDLNKAASGFDVMLAAKFIRRKITSLARTTHSGVSLIDVGTDTFGRKVTMYDDIPIRVVGDSVNSSGTVVTTFPFTEDPGDGASDTGSLYLVKLGEDDVTGLLGQNGSFMVQDFGEQEAGPYHMGRLEWYPGLAIFNRYSVVRLYGILES